MRPPKLLYFLIFSSILNLFGCGDINSNKYLVDSSDLMQEFRQNIEANRILTKQILDTTADNNLENKIIANINSKQDKNLSNDNEVLPRLSKERQAIYYIYLIEMEVNNGGFDQLYLNKFVNNEGSYMFDKTTEAFALIGAIKFGDIVKRANKIFTIHQKDFRSTSGLFDKLDQEFYETYKGENLDDLRIRFIRNNISAFVDK